MTQPDVRDRVSAVNEELAYLAQARKGRARHGPGKKACVAVIDLQRYFMDNDDPVAKAVIAANVELLEKARAKHMPIFLVKTIYDHEDEINPALRARFLEQMRTLFRNEPLSDICPELGPVPGDIVIDKWHASGFAGSTMKAEMDRLGIDTVLMTGTSTSGCVRASCIEGAALGLRVILIEDGVYDQRPLSGPVALSELADRYADVVSLQEALDYIDMI